MAAIEPPLTAQYKAAMSYYDHFDNETNGGRVFDTDLRALADLPERSLTPVEKTERENWSRKYLTILDHYDDVDPPQVGTTELLLQQRVMVPNLGAASVSSRSQLKEARQGRRYPTTISEWTGFLERVTAFQPKHNVLNPKRSDIFAFSLGQTTPPIALCNENEEQTHLLLVLKKSLMLAGLIGTVTTRGGVGRPDALTLVTNTDLPGPSDIGLIAEFKSTHNLPLPMTSKEVCDAYNKAYEEVVVAKCGRTSDWSRVCHPIGQTLGYMVENRRRYGVLSSATRSYFIFIQGDGADAIVRISDPIFVGQPNFLRAWAFMNSLACGQSGVLENNSLDWKLTSKDKRTPEAKGTRGGLRSAGAIPEGDESEDSNDEMSTTSEKQGKTCSLPETPIDHVEIVGTLGYGRNGVVFLANWHGQKVALKQFDVGKDGYEYFDKEVQAYEVLREAWGSLVPTPLFVSESWAGWIKFIGLQLGREPVPGDDVSERNNVLSALENEYGFRHEDAADGNNMVFIFDEKTGSEKLVAIDLESFTMMNRQ